MKRLCSKHASALDEHRELQSWVIINLNSSNQEFLSHKSWHYACGSGRFSFGCGSGSTCSCRSSRICRPGASLVYKHVLVVQGCRAAAHTLRLYSNIGRPWCEKYSLLPIAHKYTYVPLYFGDVHERHLLSPNCFAFSNESFISRPNNELDELFLSSEPGRIGGACCCCCHWSGTP